MSASIKEPLEPKWKRFEKLVYKLQKELAGDATVTLDDSVPGVDTGTQRQVDITIRRQVGQFDVFVAIECKDYKVPLDVKNVETVAGLFKDIRANKGAIVSASGFSKAALTLARHHGIDTLRLVDTKDHDWKAYASVPVVLWRTGFGGYQFRLSGFQTLPAGLNNSTFPAARVLSPDGEFLGTLSDLVARRWNEDTSDDLRGEVEYEIGKKVWIEVLDSKAQADVVAIVQVLREYYYGNLPVHLSGFENVQTGGVLTREVSTEVFAPGRIEQGLVEGWQKIDDPNELSVRPFMEIAYKDVVPVSEERSKS